MTSNERIKELKKNQNQKLKSKIVHTLVSLPMLLPIPHMEWKVSLMCKGIFCISEDRMRAKQITKLYVDAAKAT